MLKKIIQAGNSLAITIPKSFAETLGWKAGEKVLVIADSESAILKIQQQEATLKSGITPEFHNWLKKFNAKYKTVLEELSKK